MNAKKSLEEFNKKTYNSYFDKIKNRLTEYSPSQASELTQPFLDERRGGKLYNESAHSFDLNQGRTSFKLNTPQGNYGINSLGSSNMYSQNIIHRAINFHLIPSVRENNWEFQYSQYTGW